MVVIAIGLWQSLENLDHHRIDDRASMHTSTNVLTPLSWKNLSPTKGVSAQTQALQLRPKVKSLPLGNEL